MRRILWLCVALSACAKKDQGSYAKRLLSPNELIGGPHALGEIGDYLLGNQHVRVIIQDQGWSRGFGIFGGGIIDADLVRPGNVGTNAGGTGQDNFGELFGALFLQAFDVSDQFMGEVDGNGLAIASPGIEVVSDGASGGPAIIRTRAEGGDFVTMVGLLLDYAVGDGALRFETDYVLHPGARHVEIIGRLRNVGDTPIDLSAEGLRKLLESQGAEIPALQLPLGDVSLFGAGNTVFAPGSVSMRDGTEKAVGFDLRYAVEASYSTRRSLPALAGLVVDFLATRGQGVSYGFAVKASDRNYASMNAAEYQKDPRAEVTDSSLLVPFLVSSFSGAFYEVPPPSLAPRGQAGDSYEYTRYFLIGEGDVATIRDELFRIRKTTTGRFEGRVVNAVTGAGETEASVHVFDSDGRPYSQLQTVHDGRFGCELELGIYFTQVTAPGRYPTPPDRTSETFAQTAFELTEGGSVYRRLELSAPAVLAVQVRDALGEPLPAKVSVVGTYDAAFGGQDPKEFLFDLSIGEDRLPSDLSWRKGPDERTNRYVAERLYAAAGVVSGEVRPSLCLDQVCEKFDIYVSRGPEYSLHVTEGVVLDAGRVTRIDATLEHVVDTRDYVGADLHVHTIHSVDSFAATRDRVLSAAAEGLEIMVATDHNVVTDLAPAVASLGLQHWVNTVVGVELSTLEMGHFNAFPVPYDIGSTTHFSPPRLCEANPGNGTSFDWVACPPHALFDNLRELGGPDTVVQVNHARDTIMGYFNQYYVNPHTGLPEAPDGANYPMVGLIAPRSDYEQFGYEHFSDDFDALEILTSKRMEMLHAFTVGDVSQTLLAQMRNPCQDGHPANGPGEPLRRRGGFAAYPGVVDDWLHMLNLGKTYTATGNSDSHSNDDELGYPRTYLHVRPFKTGTRRDVPAAGVAPADIVEAIRGHRALVTNGPFLEMSVVAEVAGSGAKAQWGVGETVRYAESNVDGAVHVSIHLRAAPWVHTDKIRVYGNGEIIDEFSVRGATGVGEGTSFPPRVYTFQNDVVLVAEAVGDESLFPIVTPNEDPPTNVSQALEGIASAVGTGLSRVGDGVRAPDYVQTVRPYALTNPIWLDIDGSGEFSLPEPKNKLPPAGVSNDACPD